MNAPLLIIYPDKETARKANHSNIMPKTMILRDDARNPLAISALPGQNSMFSVLEYERVFKFLHEVVLCPDPTVGKNNLPILIGTTWLVSVVKHLSRQTDKLEDVRVCRQSLAEIVSPSTCVLFCGVRKENNGVTFFDLWREVKHLSVRGLPDAVKRRLQPHTPPKQEVPTKHLMAAMSGDMLWHDVETFIDFLANNRSQWDKDGLFA